MTEQPTRRSNRTWNTHANLWTLGLLASHSASCADRSSRDAALRVFLDLLKRRGVTYKISKQTGVSPLLDSGHSCSVVVWFDGHSGSAAIEASGCRLAFCEISGRPVPAFASSREPNGRILVQFSIIGDQTEHDGCYSTCTCAIWSDPLATNTYVERATVAVAEATTFQTSLRRPAFAAHGSNPA